MVWNLSPFMNQDIKLYNDEENIIYYPFNNM